MNLFGSPALHAHKCCEMVANGGNLLVESFCQFAEPGLLLLARQTDQALECFLFFFAFVFGLHHAGHADLERRRSCPAWIYVTSGAGCDFGRMAASAAFLISSNRPPSLIKHWQMLNGVVENFQFSRARI